LVDPTPNMDTNNSNMYIERKWVSSYIITEVCYTSVCFQLQRSSNPWLSVLYHDINII
jgi:hypothetical protein